MGILPSYTHIINPKLKHIYLMFDAKGTLIIKSPKLSQQKIESLLLKKASWIHHSINRLQQKKGKALDFCSDQELYFMGTAFPLVLLSCDKKGANLTFDGKTFTLHYSVFDTKLFEKHIDAFYKKEAQNHLPSYVNLWAEKMSLVPSAIRFRKTKRQWGSCSGKNVLSFNTMIMKLPTEVIQYIVVHELAHIVHKHHQKAFWDLVAQYMRAYKTHIKTLKTYST